MCRTVHYETMHLKAYDSGAISRRELGTYFRFYNSQRPHQALGNRTSADLFHADRMAPEKESKEKRCSIRPMLVSCGGVAGPSLESAQLLSN